MAAGKARFVLVAWLVFGVGCAVPKRERPTLARPDVAPTTQPAAAQILELDSSLIEPMYREVLAIDLPTVVRVVAAESVDIQRARYEVEASRGRLESSVGAVFPALVPSALFEHVEGTVRATPGNLVGVGFNTFQPSVALQWLLNPGRVIYDIIAARKRLRASRHQERAVELATLQRATLQFYDLCLAQARVATAAEAVSESAELLRINRLRVQSGTGVRADELRAEAQLAQRQQELISTAHSFNELSIALALTLRLDSTVTLVPAIDELPALTLVKPEYSIEDLLALAVQYRPDVDAVRALVQAVAADRGATWWGAFGPQFQAGYQIGGITGDADNTNASGGVPSNLVVNPASAGGTFSPIPALNGVIKQFIVHGSQRVRGSRDQTFGFSDQQRGTAGVGWRLSLSAFGDLRTAKAIEKQTVLDAEQQMENVRAQVVLAQLDSAATFEQIPLARRNVVSAAEALRLTRANLDAGTMTTLDILQAQDAIAQARVRFATFVVRYNKSQVNLLAALGLLDGPSLITTYTKSRETLQEPKTERGS